MQDETVAILVARMGSRRLPGKPLLPVLGQPMLGRMIERVRKTPSLRRLVLATTSLPEDDALENFAREAGLEVFRGNPEDVLGRIHAASVAARAGTVVLLLGDNPLVHADLMEEVLALFRRGSYDYAANLTREVPKASAEARCFPVGVRVQVISARALALCEGLARSPVHREHATLYLLEHPERFRLGFLEACGRWERLEQPGLSLAVNTAEDFERVSRVFERCLKEDPNFTLQTALRAWEEDERAPLLRGASA